MKNEDVERMDDELGAFTRELEERVCLTPVILAINMHGEDVLQVMSGLLTIALIISNNMVCNAYT